MSIAFILFIGTRILFDVAIKSSDYIKSDGMMVSERWITELVDTNGRFPVCSTASFYVAKLTSLSIVHYRT